MNVRNIISRIKAESATHLGRVRYRKELALVEQVESVSERDIAAFVCGDTVADPKACQLAFEAMTELSRLAWMPGSGVPSCSMGRI